MADDFPKRFLTDSQRRVVGYALTMLGLLGIAALLVISFIAMGRMAAFFSGVLWPLACAGVLALMLRPIVEIGERRLGLRRMASVILLYGLFLIFTAGLLVLLVPPLVDQILDFVGYAPTLWKNVTAYASRVYPEWIALIQRQMENPTVRQVVSNLTDEMNGLLSHALPSLKAAGIGLLGVFAFVAHLAIVPIYLFFFLLSRGEPTHDLGDHLSFLSRSVRDDVIFLVDQFIAIVVSFFRGQLLIGLIMGSLLALGFTLVGLKFGLFIGLVLGILNIIPYLGTMIGLAVTLPLAFFQPGGGWQLLGLVLLVKIIVQNIEGWVLTPKIMGDRTGLHPVTIIVAIFFWGTAFGGVLGMLFAIPLTAFFVTLWRLLRRKYFDVTPA
ncbi:MAG: AI-2E family transporter [Cephaloticoccus sp.]|nr:AI-2E family transporter [Cephaloticoccus sp.]MCF7759881.1 AI-2E family transporter [Cephaloticoccus sp.]